MSFKQIDVPCYVVPLKIHTTLKDDFFSIELGQLA